MFIKAEEVLNLPLLLYCIISSSKPLSQIRLLTDLITAFLQHPSLGSVTICNNRI